MLKSCCLISSEVVEAGGLGCVIEFSTSDDKLAVAADGPAAVETEVDGVGFEDAVAVSVGTGFSCWGSGASTTVGFPPKGRRLAMRSCGSLVIPGLPAPTSLCGVSNTLWIPSASVAEP